MEAPLTRKKKKRVVVMQLHENINCYYTILNKKYEKNGLEEKDEIIGS